MVSKLNAVGKEGSAKPSVGSIYKEIGFGGLWAGLGTRIVMIGTLTALQWSVFLSSHQQAQSAIHSQLTCVTLDFVRLIYDYVKVAFGLPTTGSAEPQKK